MVIFFAVLEHMTMEERLESLAAAWRMLPAGGYLVVIDSPNRLWCHDPHTSLVPFFHWLPDDLAMRYARCSPRPGFSSAFDGPALADPEARTRLARWGRGLSYHEFELATGELTGRRIEGMFEFLREVDDGYRAWWSASLAGRYAALLREQAPEVAPAFFDPDLTLLIGKG